MNDLETYLDKRIQDAQEQMRSGTLDYRNRKNRRDKSPNGEQLELFDVPLEKDEHDGNDGSL